MKYIEALFLILLGGFMTLLGEIGFWIHSVFLTIKETIRQLKGVIFRD